MQINIQSVLVLDYKQQSHFSIKINGAFPTFQFKFIAGQDNQTFEFANYLSKMNETPQTQCQRSDHNQPIRFICLQDTCKHERLICHLCIRDKHRKHSIANLEKYIFPLARLAMNSHLPERQRFAEAFESTISSITYSWERINQLVANQAKFIQETIIHQLSTLAQTFSEEMVQKVSQNLGRNTSTEEQVEEYVKMINFLGAKDFTDPEKLTLQLQTVQKNIDSAMQQVFRKVNVVFSDFQIKVKKYSFSNSSLREMEDNTAQKTHYSDSKENSNIECFKRKLNNSFIIDRPSVVTDSNIRQFSQELTAKIQAEDGVPNPYQIQIGLDIEDGISLMKSQVKAKVRKIVVKCCKYPETQLSKILSLTNLQQLEIFWYELAKKEYLIKIINSLQNLKVLILNCANEFDEQCCRLVPKRLAKIRKLEYGWDFLNSIREYDDNIYFRLSPYTNRGCPLKTSITREMVVSLKKIENVWLGDFMYFRSSNNEIPFKNIKEFTLGQTNGKSFRIPQKLCVQLKDMRQLLSLSILHVNIDEKKLSPILMNNPFIKSFVVQGCEDITDESLKVLAKNCSSLTHLSIRESKIIEGAPIWDMQNLTTLILVECTKIRVEEAVAGIAKMKYLSYLNIYGNKWVNDGLVRSIPNHENMHSLNLGSTSITDESLESLYSMKNIKVLCIDCNKLSGFAIARLAQNIRGIEKISLWGLVGQLHLGYITDNDFEILAQELTCLNHLSIRYCRPFSPSILLKFKSLRFIQTDRQNITPEIEQQLEQKGVKIFLDLSKHIIEDQL